MKRQTVFSPSWMTHSLETLEERLLLSVSSNVYDIDSASYLGGTGTSDAVRGAIIESDGTVVLAANISSATPGGVTPILLNGATSTSSGAIIRLSSDGSTVLSVTRLAGTVLDLSSDSAGNLYVAMYDQGFAKLNSTASAILYSKTPTDLGFANVQRIDAGPSGYCAILGGSASIDNGSTAGDYVDIFDISGNLLGGWNSTKWKNDVAIDEASQTIVTLGYRNANDSVSGLPVQISYYRGSAYDGTTKYTGYDWSTSTSDPTKYLNAPTNNMADTRGYRCEIGEDGMLYMAFESAGGNSIFRYDPFNIMQPSNLAGGDRWNSIYNGVDQHVTQFGRYNPSDGAQILNQEIVCRYNSDGMNTCRNHFGAIFADASGRVYIGGDAAWGLPLPTHSLYTFDPNNPGFNPGNGSNYIGGGWLMVMSNDLSTRLYTTRINTGVTRAIAARSLSDGSAQIVFAGSGAGDTYTVNAVQGGNGGGQDGWFGVMDSSAGDPSNHAPNASFTTSGTVSNGIATITFNASASGDPDGNPLTYLWNFGDGTTGTGVTVSHNYSSASTYTATLTVLDTSTGWSEAYQTFGPPTAKFSFSPRVGEAPLTETFDATATTDPNDDPAALNYAWDFGDGSTGTGRTLTHSYSRSGVYTIALTVTDSFGGQSVARDTIGVSVPGGVSVRLDFGGDTSTVASGYTLATTAVYTSQQDFGWQHSTTDYFASGYSGGDPLYSDYVGFALYPVSKEDGTFLVDVPNGEYEVIARFGNKYNSTFPGIIANGVRQAATITAGPSTNTAVYFKTKVTNGQFALTLASAAWFISGLEIFDVGPALQDNGSFVTDPTAGQPPLNVSFNASGTALPNTQNLTYAWNFGDGTNASGVQTSHNYASPGTYGVTLTVTGGTGSRIVNFGGDYVSSNKDVTGIRCLKAFDVDGDGLADDTATFVDFSVQPGAPMVSAGNASMPSGNIYGGVAGLRIDDPNGLSIYPDSQITNSGTADFFDLRDDCFPPLLEHRASLLWIKDEFLNGAHAQRVYFDANSQMSITFTFWEHLDAGRWMVQDGEQFYVSQATFSGTGTKTIDPSSTTWALYNPQAPYNLNFDQANAVFAAHTFTDVRATGVLLEQDGAVGGARVWYRVSNFTADANWAPATTTITVEQLPTVSVAAPSPNAAEQSRVPGQYVITRSGAGTTYPLTVNYDIAGTASSADYDASVPLTGTATIPAGSDSTYITITPWDDLITEGNETLILTLRPGTGYTVSPTNTATVTIADNEGPIVDFNRDYGTGNALLRPSEGGAGMQTVGDFDGDGLSDDTKTYNTFSMTVPLSPNIVSGVYSGPSATFYGGITAIQYNTTVKGFNDNQVDNATPIDRVNLRFGGTESSGVDFDSVWLWKSQDFVYGPTPAHFGKNSVFTAHFNRTENTGTFRWVLGDGTNYYVSQKTFTGSTTWSGAEIASSLWALYTPSGTNIDFNQNTAVFNVPVSGINVQTAGFLTDVDGGPGARCWIIFDQVTINPGDNTAPTVTAANTTGTPDKLNSFSATFSEDVISSIGAGDLTLYNKTTQTSVNLSDATFSYNRNAATATWNLQSLNLPAGYYTATIAAAGVSDESANPMVANYTKDIYVAVPGDANLDGAVDVVDLGLMATNYGSSSGVTWAKGDFNADGAVDVIDLGLLATAYGQNVTPPAGVDATIESIPLTASVSAPTVSALTLAASPTTTTTDSSMIELSATTILPAVPVVGDVLLESATASASDVDVLTISSRAVIQAVAGEASEPSVEMNLDMQQIV